MAEKDNLLALQMATLYKYYFPHNLAFSHAWPCIGCDFAAITLSTTAVQLILLSSYFWVIQLYLWHVLQAQLLTGHSVTQGNPIYWYYIFKCYLQKCEGKWSRMSGTVCSSSGMMSAMWHSNIDDNVTNITKSG
jgi:hypothetical protein